MSPPVCTIYFIFDFFRYHFLHNPKRYACMGEEGVYKPPTCHKLFGADNVHLKKDLDAPDSTNKLGRSVIIRSVQDMPSFLMLVGVSMLQTVGFD